MKTKLIFLIVTVFSLNTYAKLGGGDPSDLLTNPIIRDRFEPSPLYFFVIVPIFGLSLVALYFLCHKYSVTQKGLKHLIQPLLSGIVLFAFIPSVYSKFYQIYVELEIESSELSRYDFPFVASGKILYGILLILIWFSVQPIILQLIFKRKDKPLLYFPFILFFFGYGIWFIYSLFSPLMVIR